MSNFLRVLAAITIPSTIAHTFLPADLHVNLASLVFGRESALFQFPRYHAPENLNLVMCHLWGGAIWMLVALVQTSPRGRALLGAKGHSVLGYIGFVSALVCMLGLSVFIFRIGFGLAERMAAAFFGLIFARDLVRALLAARRRDYETHSHLMTRAVVISFGVGTIRLIYMPAVILKIAPESIAENKDFFGGVFWLAMVINYLIADNLKTTKTKKQN